MTNPTRRYRNLRLPVELSLQLTGHPVSRLACFAFALLLITAPSSIVVAQAPSTAAAVDPSVEQVVSGGRWQSHGTSGSYRVVVTRLGWEELRRVAVLEWIAEAPLAGSNVRRATIRLNERADSYSLASPVIIRRGTSWILRLSAASRPLAPYDRRVEFLLGGPDSVKLARPVPTARHR